MSVVADQHVQVANQAVHLGDELVGGYGVPEISRDVDQPLVAMKVRAERCDEVSKTVGSSVLGRVMREMVVYG